MRVSRVRGDDFPSLGIEKFGSKTSNSAKLEESTLYHLNFNPNSTAGEMESSRIFVRNLPPNLSEEEFKTHFSKQHAITDAKYIGHRRIGYVGFRTPEDAVKAVKYFNKSFIRMSRIGVELARPVSMATCQIYNLTN